MAIPEKEGNFYEVVISVALVFILLVGFLIFTRLAVVPCDPQKNQGLTHTTSTDDPLCILETSGPDCVPVTNGSKDDPLGLFDDDTTSTHNVSNPGAGSYLDAP